MPSKSGLHPLTISIHALLAESDSVRIYRSIPLRRFLSTLSLRRATENANGRYQTDFYFYPRSPCGERHPKKAQKAIRFVISIHALLAESDDRYTAQYLVQDIFLSTLSLRRATPLMQRSSRRASYFYPRSPCGERPLRDALYCTVTEISIHALLAESDAQTVHKINNLQNFYPRSPCGERHYRVRTADCGLAISIHALLAESDLPCGAPQRGRRISIHALLAESDRRCLRRRFCPRHFYPRSPCGERR